MSNSPFPFSKKNYRLMLIGLGMIILGFVIMALDGRPHGNGVLGLTVGPLVVLSGFIFEFYAIFAKTEKS